MSMREILIRTAVLILLNTVLAGARVNVAQWDFDRDSDLQQWVPNTYLSNVFIKEGIVSADAVGWDPFFHCRGIAIAARPWQYVVIRLRADRPGICVLFWSGELEG